MFLGGKRSDGGEASEQQSSFQTRDSGKVDARAIQSLFGVGSSPRK